jgi:multidrug efflux pump
VIYGPLNQYHVVMGVDQRYAQNAESLKQVQVVTASGARVPLSAFTHFEVGNSPLSVQHQGLFAADTVSFSLAPGVSLEQGVRAIEQAVARSGLPTQEIQAGFQGSANALQQSLAQQPWLILAALVTMYIVLGILYESYVHPLTILSTLPSAGIGALLALMLLGEEFSLIALIGVFLLIGIVKKNAIMMVDFALQAEREHHLSSHDAIYQACLVRFRPIMMTTVSALFGALPLVLASGAGVELRRPLGLTIVGGLILSQALTLYTTPVVYLYLDRFRLWANRKRGQPEHA